MVIRLLLMLVLMVAGTQSCQRKSEKFVEVSGHIFVFNYRMATATYLVTLKKISLIPEGTIAVAEFENPAGGEPLVTREKIFEAWDKITLQSPNINCVRKDRQYNVKISLFDKTGEILQRLESHFASDVDQSILPGKPLVIGPFNDKNPEVFYGDGSADYRNTDACPRPTCSETTSEKTCT